MSGLRLRTDFWAGALIRRASAAGAYVAVGRRGDPQAGAVFVLVDRRDGSVDLYGPAPQSLFDAVLPAERLFTPIGRAMPEEAARARLEQEQRFDPDLWLVEIEDRQGRAFIEVIEAP
jgi:hypothetical protein